MPRTAFEQQLHELEDDLLALGSMVEKAVLRAIDALKRRDHVEAQRVVDDDKLVNEKRFQIEEQCLQLLATWVPPSTASSSQGKSAGRSPGAGR